jgi:Raf kinase inhibitor-like YbhB/YbcL family protein
MGIKQAVAAGGILLACAWLLWGCGAAPDPGLPAAGVPVAAAPDTGFTLRSAAFGEGQSIPARYTCEGLDLSPPLAWSAPPAGARSLALVVRDPDAPDPAAPQMTWTHWLLLNLPPVAGHLPERAGEPGAGGSPPGSLDGLNDWGRAGWGGPCPPVGRHRYQFVLFALDTQLTARPDWTRQQLEELARTHALGRAELTGVYQKHQP